MKIFIASDHAGYYLKEGLKKYLLARGEDVADLGNRVFDPADDYPDFIFPLAQKVAQTPGSLGIILGRTGNGEAIAANKVKGAYASLCLSTPLAQKAREHNHANIIALGADFLDLTSAQTIVDLFLQTPPSSAERHVRRVQKIIAYESTHLS